MSGVTVVLTEHEAELLDVLVTSRLRQLQDRHNAGDKGATALTIRYEEVQDKLRKVLPEPVVTAA